MLQYLCVCVNIGVTVYVAIFVCMYVSAYE